ncbi:hypothetical protein K7432_009769 [Basidiobolus ranarum]|uniref:Uncharacterized protein n=1 Tax=Basidiobolus ranarum TaxID=34480 RepID=A0ABR2VWI9_9FUNG
MKVGHETGKCPLAGKCPYYDQVKSDPTHHMTAEHGGCPVKGKCPRYDQVKEQTSQTLPEGHPPVSEGTTGTGCPFAK